MDDEWTEIDPGLSFDEWRREVLSLGPRPAAPAGKVLVIAWVAVEDAPDADRRAPRLADSALQGAMVVG